MPLAAGNRLTHYDVLGKLGAGAMGEVWLAKDTRLDREVAIKVLPAEFADDDERLMRFEREAKTLASLNHPNVAQIFGVDQVEDTSFLVLELVPGESLEERLARGPLPLDEALDVCRQIAEGLEAAHEAGVIHRDLKPGNVRLTPDGKVKVLDFGLAKPTREGRGGSSTDSVLSTEAGRLLGTPTYMAPEQARGRAIDRRVDVWAFGCVLYEGLTAKRAFAGDTLSDVLVAVLEREPDWSQLPASTPAYVRTLLARCLVKDPRQRLRDIGDARLELEEPPALDATLSGTRGKRNALALALPWVTAAVLGALWLRAILADEPLSVASRAAHLAVRLPLGVELCRIANNEQNQILAISPDGSRVALVTEEGGVRRLHLRELDSLATVTLAGTEDALCPFFSPDGKWIAFAARGRLFKVPASGGQPIEIAPIDARRGGAWGPDGSIVLAADLTAGLVRIQSGGGAPVELTRLDTERGERSHRWPVFLPGGDEVAFTVGTIERPGNYDDSIIDAVSLSTGERRTLLTGASFVRALSASTLVFGRNGLLFAVPMEQANGAALGSAVPVLEGVGGVSASGVLYFDIAVDGTLVYAQRDPQEREFELAWVAPNGSRGGARDATVEPLPLPAREYGTPRISPDGKLVAVTIGPIGGTADVWIADVGSGSLSRLTFDKQSDSPVWSPDGLRVVYSTRAGGHSTFAWRRADGSDEGEVLVAFDDALPRYSLGFTPDGDGLLFLTQGSAGTEQDIYCWSKSDGSVRPVANSAAGEHYPAVSPDGAWMAYVSNDLGTREVFVQGYPTRQGRWQITNGGMAPLWSRDGSELFLVHGREILAIPVQTEPSFSSGAPRTLAELDFIPEDESTRNYDVGLDGRFLVVRPTSKESYLGHVNVVLDWPAQLRASKTSD